MIEELNYFWECPQCGDVVFGHVGGNEENPEKECLKCGAKMIGTPVVYRHAEGNPFEGFVREKQE